MAAAAGIAAGSSILSGVLGGKGAKKAAKIQAAAQDRATQAQQQQFNQIQANEAPFLQAGTGALGGLQGLLGLKGNEAQGSAIDLLKASPLFQSQYGTGIDSILQAASATGGLRGGNVNNSLAQFGSGLLSQVIQNQIGNLGGLVSVGQNAGAGLASAGTNFANNMSNIALQGGNSQASSILGRGAITNNTINDLSKILQNVVGGGMKGGTTPSPSYPIFSDGTPGSWLGGDSLGGTWLSGNW